MLRQAAPHREGLHVVEQGEADQAVEADLPATDEAGVGAGRVAVSKVRIARKPLGPSQDASEPAGRRLPRQSRDPLCLLPYGRARAVELLNTRCLGPSHLQNAVETVALSEATLGPGT
jgi:hypothetical protein